MRTLLLVLVLDILVSLAFLAERFSGTRTEKRTRGVGTVQVTPILQEER